MIVGNMAGVPFTYCYSTLYLVHQKPITYSTPVTVLFYFALLCAYYVWDTANSQKNRFRMQSRRAFIPRFAFPQLPWGTLVNPKFIKTTHGNLILTDGWFGIGRKLHYTADLVMALLWGAITGIGSFIPYFYVCFFSVVLIHRVSRDMERCAKKYKKVNQVFVLYFKDIKGECHYVSHFFFFCQLYFRTGTSIAKYFPTFSFLVFTRVPQAIIRIHGRPFQMKMKMKVH